ncbi:MAG: response regulator [Nitrospinaceae bacterium]|nr:response regulator [Nitrospinaceae bacterium]NIR53411.1 response regulator [Nitrospinaceae bacterium]NIS83815.1 response regulator [Nitrospinaceae bacterium]NIT80611.1 response regulator [Nitrospinaceae bacterium]NIU42935.1 response regulator [Nitrospinaceae bacterium]
MVDETLKILLVEDDEDDAFFIKDLIAEADLHPRPSVKHAFNSNSAIEILRNHPFDVCLFDYRLGEMDGIDLLRIVRQMDIHTPIIFLTGQGDQEVAVEAMKSGATDYRTKGSLSSESLFQSIRFAIQLRKEEDRRIQAEEQLKKYNKELTQTNKELQVSMEKLRNAQDQILRSEKLASIGRLAAGVCHELLNPLNIISGHVQALMLEREKDKGLNTDLESIMEEISRIEKIVGGLLKFSRKEDMEMIFVDINEELESVLSIMEKDMQIDNVRVVREFGTGLPKIKIDANRMRQVFLNLTNNARHAMEKGGVLTVQTFTQTKEVKQNRRKTDMSVDPEEIPVVNQKFLQIVFADTGTGIRKDDMVKLFDPFFTTKPEDKGTGLGLSVCHTIVEKHSGTIEVDSHWGKGAKFIISLPCIARRKSDPKTAPVVRQASNG